MSTSIADKKADHFLTVAQESLDDAIGDIDVLLGANSSLTRLQRLSLQDERSKLVASAKVIRGVQGSFRESLGQRPEK